MSLTVAIYDYRDKKQEMDEIRPAHRDFLASNPGLRLSGPLGDAEGAVLIFEGEAAEIEEWLNSDPFWKAGLIAERTVKPWNAVLGSWRAELAL